MSVSAHSDTCSRQNARQIGAPLLQNSPAQDLQNEFDALFVTADRAQALGGSAMRASLAVTEARVRDLTAELVAAKNAASQAQEQLELLHPDAQRVIEKGLPPILDQLESVVKTSTPRQRFVAQAKVQQVYEYLMEHYWSKQSALVRQVNHILFSYSDWISRDGREIHEQEVVNRRIDELLLTTYPTLTPAQVHAIHLKSHRWSTIPPLAKDREGYIHGVHKMFSDYIALRI